VGSHLRDVPGTPARSWIIGQAAESMHPAGLDLRRGGCPVRHGSTTGLARRRRRPQGGTRGGGRMRNDRNDTRRERARRSPRASSRDARGLAFAGGAWGSSRAVLSISRELESLPLESVRSPPRAVARIRLVLAPSLSGIPAGARAGPEASHVGHGCGQRPRSRTCPGPNAPAGTSRSGGVPPRESRRVRSRPEGLSRPPDPTIRRRPPPVNPFEFPSGTGPGGGGALSAPRPGRAAGPRRTSRRRRAPRCASRRPARRPCTRWGRGRPSRARSRRGPWGGSGSG
jgi:hypothetical protein